MCENAQHHSNGLNDNADVTDVFSFAIRRKCYVFLRTMLYSGAFSCSAPKLTHDRLWKSEIPNHLINVNAFKTNDKCLC